MTARRTRAALALVAGAALAGGCGGGDGDDDGRRASEPTPTVVTAPARQRVVVARRGPARVRPVPRPGTATLQPGPFTDRIRVAGLRTVRGGRPRVSGTMRHRTDVSEILSLTIQADFYDAAGRYVGSGVQHAEDAEEFHAHPFAIRVPGPPRAAAAATAVVTVPDLVNE